MVMTTERFLATLPKQSEYQPLEDGRYVLPRLLTDRNGRVAKAQYYPFVTAIQKLGPDVYGLKSRDLDKVAHKLKINPEGEGTLTVVLFPDKNGNTSPRYMTKHGKTLGRSPCPVIVEGLEVSEGGQYGFEIRVDEMIPYPEMQEIVEMFHGDYGEKEIQGWNKHMGVPIKFGDRINPMFDHARIRLHSDYNYGYDFGERPIRRGGFDLSPYGWRHNTGLYAPPSALWGFRLIGGKRIS